MDQMDTEEAEAATDLHREGTDRREDVVDMGHREAASAEVHRRQAGMEEVEDMALLLE